MIAFAFMPTPLKSSFVQKLSNAKDAKDLPFWLSGLVANTHMEKSKESVSVACID